MPTAIRQAAAGTSISGSIGDVTTAASNAIEANSQIFIIALAAIAAVALVVGYLTVRKTAAAIWQSHQNARATRAQQRATDTEAAQAARAAAKSAGPLAALGILGSWVSLYGLFGFATDTGELPVVLAIAFCAIFDIAELGCFTLLYLAAGRVSRWTPAMRKTRRMAWGLVAASATMNYLHAPGGFAGAVALAAVPVISAKLFEHGLDRMLEANAGHDEQITPGPVRLIQLLWLHAWAALFARLGLDATSINGQVPAEARIRRAATVLTDLGRRLDAQDEINRLDGARWRKGRAATSVNRARARAQTAIDAAGVATDQAASLSLARHLVARGRAADLARMDVTNPMAVLTLLEELAITPTAEALEAGAHAALADQAAQDALKTAEDAEQRRLAAEQARDQAQADADNARQEQRDAEQERRTAEQARDTATAQAQTARRTAAEEEAAAQAAHEARRNAEHQQRTAEQAAQAARERAEADQAQAQEASEERRATEAALSIARQQVLAAANGEDDPNIAETWKSTDKQQAWQEYQRLAREHSRDPKAPEIHEAIHEAVHIGTVRGWLPEFRRLFLIDVARRSQAAATPPTGLTIHDLTNHNDHGAAQALREPANA